MLGHELDKKRGNVFYDVKISYLRNDLNGTLFEGQVDTQIIKGKKLFDHPVSMDICKICARQKCHKGICSMTNQMGNDKKFLSPNQCMPLGIYETYRFMDS